MNKENEITLSQYPSSETTWILNQIFSWALLYDGFRSFFPDKFFGMPPKTNVVQHLKLKKAGLKNKSTYVLLVTLYSYLIKYHQRASLQGAICHYYLISASKKHKLRQRNHSKEQTNFILSRDTFAEKKTARTMLGFWTRIKHRYYLPRNAAKIFF